MNPQNTAEVAGLEWAHPLVREWFLAKFGSPTEPQIQGWPSIVARKNVLISAPTGSGKTLAAFLSCIDSLVRKAIAGELRDETEVLYVSPLKALGNDIQKNLDIPLGEILELARERGFLMPEIRTAVRTGDTLAHSRRAMQKRPPHILVTTPESLYILLTSEKGRNILRPVQTVIVDEIHAIADDRRGSHLSLSLERLEALAERCPVRIGLSATQKPMDAIGHFLIGTGRPEPVLVCVPQRGILDLAVEVPSSELSAVASNESWEEIYKRIAELVQEHRSTLIFVNTRRLAERVAHHLAGILGENVVASHHGSLSRARRLAVEGKLKNGEIRALVATASLELGIDIGTIDLVCQIGSPRAIAVGLQRVGRAGHWRGAVPKGRFFATTRDDLLECGALVHSIHCGELDQIEIPEAPLDILAQQVVACCAVDDWREDDLYALVCRAYPYRNLKRSEFDEVIAMLSEGIAARRGRYGAYLHRDQVNHRVKGRRGSRLAAITSGGAIPDNALYTVVAEPEGLVVGTVDEDFAVESLRGDIFLLGNSSWRIRRVQSGSVSVEDAKGAPPNVPFWRGEAPSRTPELSMRVAEVREQIDFLSRGSADSNNTTGRSTAIGWLIENCGMDKAGAEQSVAYILAGRAVLHAVPSQRTIVAERFFDESGGMQLIIHAPFGGRINKAWGMALRKRFCRSLNFELQASATDNGINISLGEQHSFPLADVFHFLHSSSVEGILEQSVLASPIFATRWRWVAGRALALLRFSGGKKVPPQIQRMRSEDLLAAVFPEAIACQENISGDIAIPDHPLVREAMRDSLTEAMDLDGLKEVLDAIASGRIECQAVETPVPSEFSHEILNANPYAYIDDAPLEERRARAVSMRRALPESVLSEIGNLDPAAIHSVRDEAWPDVRSPDELHDALLDFVALPAMQEHIGPRGWRNSTAEWAGYFAELATQRRAGLAVRGDRTYWFATERAKTFAALYPDANCGSHLPEVEKEFPSHPDALFACVRGWLSCTGPITIARLGGLLDIPADEIEQSVLRLESTGGVLRGRFTDESVGQIEWCDRRLLARIHQRTLGTLRKQVQPVTAAQFMRWLLRWQHLMPRDRLAGEQGIFEVIHQLQGYEAPSNAWEPQILATRILGYDPTLLDRLCLSGTIGWGRLSPRAPGLRNSDGIPRRVVPSSIAPITFFVRENSDWMPGKECGELKTDTTLGLSPPAVRVHRHLHERGASFFSDIVRGAGILKAEAENALWELTAAGIITADGFDNIRALVDPKRRAGRGRAHNSRPRHSLGRWSILHPNGSASDSSDDPSSSNSRMESICWVLLKRYGVVFREILARESIAPKWRELLRAFRRLEDQGEIRGGRFVSGFLGEQFALPIAVEGLRASSRIAPAGEFVTISAADPLNLVGILVPGERVPSNSGKTITLKDGLPIDEQIYNPVRSSAAGFQIGASDMTQTPG